MNARYLAVLTGLCALPAVAGVRLEARSGPEKYSTEWFVGRLSRDPADSPIKATLPDRGPVVKVKQDALKGLEIVEVDVEQVPVEEVERPPDRVSVDIPIEFEFDSTEWTRESRTRIENLGRALASAKLKDCRFAINGHTDTTGGEGHNLDLSLRRARAVKAYLRDHHHLGPLELMTRGFGESCPIDQPGTDGYRSQTNRRVEVEKLSCR